jgi:predicted AlkP superfamily pyrophosphatase or phosphodiesterase
MKQNFRLIFLSLLLFSFTFAEPPDFRLVVFLSVDQLGADLLSRYRELYSGGFRWLLDHGWWYTNTHHEHGYTATGPGHFTLATGRYPGPAGVIGNSWYDRELKRTVYCVEDNTADVIGYPGRHRSYGNIGIPALGDWMKAAYPQAKVYAVAGKDRAAIFMAGKQPDLALWYNWSGAFVTSSYYATENPAWLTAFNRKLNVAAYRDSLWRRELDPEQYERYARPDYFPGEMDTYLTMPYSPVFPIGFDSSYTTDDVLNNIGSTPWLERFTIALAETILVAEHLGRDESPDLLSISLSATDWIIHNFGPYSQEALDALLKVDRYLQRFLERVDRVVGLENVLFVFTADHGGMPLPEYLREVEHLPAGRIHWDSLEVAYSRAYREIDRRFGDHAFITRSGLGFYFDREMMAQRSIPLAEIARLVRREIEPLPGVGAVLSKEEILNAPENDTLLVRMRHSFHPVKSPDLWILPRRYWVFRYPYGTSHSTPYVYDTHVPLLFAWEEAKPNIITRKVATVDIAPTIARILRIPVPNSIDGKVISEFR